jgi:hypothetical protein
MPPTTSARSAASPHEADDRVIGGATARSDLSANKLADRTVTALTTPTARATAAPTTKRAPGGPDEDRDGDFTHGGWQAPLLDEEAGRVMFDTAGAPTYGNMATEGDVIATTSRLPPVK